MTDWSADRRDAAHEKVSGEVPIRSLDFYIDAVAGCISPRRPQAVSRCEFASEDEEERLVTRTHPGDSVTLRTVARDRELYRFARLFDRNSPSAFCVI